MSEIVFNFIFQDLQKKLDISGLDQNEIKTAKSAQIKEFPTGICEAGADALRFNLCSFDFKGNKVWIDYFSLPLILTLSCQRYPETNMKKTATIKFIFL